MRRSSRRAMTWSTSRLRAWSAARDGSEGGVILVLFSLITLVLRHLFFLSYNYYDVLPRSLL